jgi:release factor glutamine methyltransferase
MKPIAFHPVETRMKKSNFFRAPIKEAVEQLTSLLSAISETPALDAQVLVAFLFNQPRSWLNAHGEEPLDLEISERLEGLIPRLFAEEPLPYILGKQEFFGREFMVNQDVMIPRPETELLVEYAIAYIQDNIQYIQPWKIIDIGTGSGNIAISLAASIPGLKVIATDFSLNALRVAKINAKKAGVEESIHFIQADLLEHPELTGDFQIVLSNPPYIPTEVCSELSVSNYEPNIALDGGEDGLEIILQIIASTKSRLATKGLFLMEMESSQGARVKSFAESAFPGARIEIIKDLARHDRLLRVEK